MFEHKHSLIVVDKGTQTCIQEATAYNVKQELQRMTCHNTMKTTEHKIEIVKVHLRKQRVIFKYFKCITLITNGFINMIL